MPTDAGTRRCSNCRHFHNSPAYLENLFKGFVTLSSAHASIRKEDGVCEYHDIYLSADQWCEDFARPTGTDQG